MALLSVSSKGELAVLTRPRYLRHSLFLGTLARMPLEGGAPREIADGVREADWTPDGSDLVVIARRQREGPPRVPARQGAGRDAAATSVEPAFLAASGDRIAFFEHPIKYDDRGSVAVVDLAGKKTRPLGGLLGRGGPRLVERRQRGHVLRREPRTTTSQIYAVDARREARAASLQSAGGLTILDIAPDGRWLASRDDQWREILASPPARSRSATSPGSS